MLEARRSGEWTLYKYHFISLRMDYAGKINRQFDEVDNNDRTNRRFLSASDPHDIQRQLALSRSVQGKADARRVANQFIEAF